MLIPTLLIGLTISLTVAAAYFKHRDTFHPALVMGPMLAFHYCYSPLRLLATDGFYGFLRDEHVTRAQWVHLTGVLALCLGLLFSSMRTPEAGSANVRAFFDRSKLVRGSLVLGALGIAGFTYGIINVGGFSEAYGRSYGGGSAESGWVRELWLLCLPALLMLSISHENRRITLRELVLVAAFSGPFLIHGLLGARRGPTFMGVVGAGLVFYMARGQRPRLPTLLAGGALLGILMLILVSNRSEVYWGAALDDMYKPPTTYFNPGAGQDFIYGAGLIIVTDETQDFSWGVSYVTMLLVRPIPAAIWPTKYQDAAEFFGRPVLDENLGVDIKSFRLLGWTAARGAAPGLVGDMWREFSWGFVFVLFLIGSFYGHSWRRATANSGAWLPTYCLAASLSLYLVMQTLEAMLYRFLFCVFPMLAVLFFARHPTRQMPPAGQPDRPLAIASRSH